MEYPVSFLEAKGWLEHLSSERKFFRKKLDQGLEVVNGILDHLERPDKKFQYRIIIGGTAGKGTTCRYLEQTLENYGKKTALISSPHLQVITERIRIGGQLISMEDFGNFILKIKTVAEAIGAQPTYYEAIVLAGVLAAKEREVEVLICEVGLGGEFDAVNALKGKRIAGVTFIGDDHLEMFGNSMEKLARAKAGIFTADSIYSVSYEKNFRELFLEVAQSDIHFLSGVKTKMSKKIAKKICEKVLNRPVLMEAVKLPCRWEKIDLGEGKTLILDGAHSAPRFEYILPRIKKLTGKKAAILALGKNHNPAIFNIILDYFDEIFLTKLPNRRETWTPDDLFGCLGRGSIMPDSIKAFRNACIDNDKIFVNSFLLGGKIRDLFYNPQKILTQQTEWPK